MGRATRLAVAVLAAGASRRFGDADKLCASFRGDMLGLAACRAMPMERFVTAHVIASSAAHPCSKGWRAAGFEVVENRRADEGMGTSVALAAQLARDAEADALMIALADMPMVPAAHFTAMADAAQNMDANGLAVSCDGSTRMPPAVFGQGRFAALTQLSADQGARSFLADGVVISCPPEWLVDIDTPEALTALR